MVTEDPAFRRIEKQYRIQKKKVGKHKEKKFVPVYPPLYDVINSFNDQQFDTDDSKNISIKGPNLEQLDHNPNYNLSVDNRVHRLPNLKLHEEINRSLNNEVKHDIDSLKDISQPTLNTHLSNFECEVYSFPAKPGLYLLRNVLDERAQIYWGLRCIRDFSRSNYTNIINLRQQQEEEKKKKGAIINCLQ